MESEEFQRIVLSMLIRCAVLLTGRQSHEVGIEIVSWLQARLNLGKILNETNSSIYQENHQKFSFWDMFHLISLRSWADACVEQHFIFFLFF